MNYWEPFGNIREMKRGRMKKGGDFCFVWNLLAQKARELHLCNKKKTYFCFGTNRPLIERHPCCQQHPNPPLFFLFNLIFPYVPNSLLTFISNPKIILCLFICM